jgi:arsenate reductase
MIKTRVLFVCIHNSARSQMAETFLNDFGQEKFIAESAGIEAGKLNPIVVEAMKEVGYDISKNETNSVFDFFKEGRQYDLVVKVCDAVNGQLCPVFPGVKAELYWNITDPSALAGTPEEKLIEIRKIRDLIKVKVEGLIQDYKVIQHFPID